MHLVLDIITKEIYPEDRKCAQKIEENSGEKFDTYILYSHKSLKKKS